MSKRWERADVRLVSETGPAKESLPMGEETPFIIGVLGDFRGCPMIDKANRRVSLADRKPTEIDRDNFDAVMERLDVRFEASLDISSGEESEERSVQLSMRGIQSFHPDEILKQVEPLRALIDLRRALEEPARFNAAAAEIRKWIKAPEPPTARPQPRSPSKLLEAILEEANPSEAPSSRKGHLEDIERLVQDVVSSHAIRVDVSQQQQLIAIVEKVLGEKLRAILHHREFQRLEAVWRSLYFLVMNAETGPALKIYLINVSRAELEADLTDARGIEDSSVFKNLSSFASESEGLPWGALIGNYDFSMSPEDVYILDRIAQLAHHLRAPFVAGAGPRFFGVDSFASLPSAKTLARLFDEVQYDAWRTFQRSPQARSVGLLLPRFLLRLPYGAQTDPVGSFSFEEGGRGEDHDKYVWGNPAFAFAVILAREFSESGWSLNPARLVGQLEGIPLHVYEDAGVSEAKPCSEVLLSDESVAALEDEGFIPLVSYRDRDFIVVHCAQSVSNPPAVLAGQW